MVRAIAVEIPGVKPEDVKRESHLVNDLERDEWEVTRESAAPTRGARS